MNVLKRLVPHASQLMGVDLDPENPKRSLNSIVEMAKKSDLFSHDELKRLEEAFINIKKKAKPYSESILFFSIQDK